jgi:hypothetical protein
MHRWAIFASGISLLALCGALASEGGGTGVDDHNAIK